MTSGDGIRVFVLARTEVVPQILSLKKMPSLSSHVALPSEQVPWFSYFPYLCHGAVERLSHRCEDKLR